MGVSHNNPLLVADSVPIRSWPQLYTSNITGYSLQTRHELKPRAEVRTGARALVQEKQSALIVHLSLSREYIEEIAAMPQSTLEMTKDLVSAQIQSGTLSAEEMHSALHHIYQSLMALKNREEAEFPVSAAGMSQAPSDWRKSITRHAITCLKCGAHLKQLTGRHLRGHNLDARSYRAKYSIPATQPLSARATAAKRRRIAAEVKPWEKSPRYMHAQEERAATAKRSGRKRAASRQ
jgi:predicted transcriptional regulator